jgi:hypothetical protein
MKHSEFRIGLEFWCREKQRRCTDVGSRVIIAISQEPHEVVALIPADSPTEAPQTRSYITDDASWLSGPPYQVAEQVFDKYDLEACSLDQERTPPRIAPR